MHGQGSDKYDNVRIGLNGRLDTLQAAILIEKMRIFREEIERRNTIAARYNAALADIAPGAAGDERRYFGLGPVYTSRPGHPPRGARCWA